MKNLNFQRKKPLNDKTPTTRCWMILEMMKISIT